MRKGNLITKPEKQQPSDELNEISRAAYLYSTNAIHLFNWEYAQYTRFFNRGQHPILFKFNQIYSTQFLLTSKTLRKYNHSNIKSFSFWSKVSAPLRI
jgi:hypothetical protein